MILGDAFKIKLWAQEKIEALESEAEEYKYISDVAGIICVSKAEILKELIKFINESCNTSTSQSDY